MRYYRLFFLLLSTIAFSWSRVSADEGGFVIDQYHVDMQLHEDASMDIVETLDVNFTAPRYGIYREIPLLDSANEYIHIRDISVDDNLLADQTDNGETLTLNIGDPNRTVTGVKRYTIRYTIDNAIVIFNWWDELYRNVIGPKRATTISNVSRSLSLPKNYTTDSSWSLVLRWWYGEKNTTGASFYQSSDTKWLGTLSSFLRPGQGVTIVLKFQPWYFVFPVDYKEYFVRPDQSETNRYHILWGFAPFLVMIGISVGKSIKSSGSWWKSDRPVTIYYTSPKDIDPSLAFYLWYNNPRESKVFTSLLYYRATRWWATINQQKSQWIFWFLQSDEYHVVETSNDPQGANDVDKSLLQKFFGIFDAVNDDIQLNEKSYTSIESLLDLLQQNINASPYIQKKEWWLGNLGVKELTPLWKDIFEQLRGYKEYLTKVERPVIEQELKTDPNFLNKILPWSVLFGVESRLLKMVEDLMVQMEWYHSHDGRPLTYATFASMNRSLRSYTMPPRSSSHSGFHGWFSGWWRGGWGWWSW